MYIIDRVLLNLSYLSFLEELNSNHFINLENIFKFNKILKNIMNFNKKFNKV